MASTTLNFFDSLSVRIQGQGSVYDKLIEYYEFIPTCEDSEPDFTCVVQPIEAPTEVVLGGGESEYGRSGDWFIIRRVRAKSVKTEIHMNKGWDLIRCTPQTRHYFVVNLIEYAIRRQMVKEGVALIHGSGINYDGTGYVFPAWRHTGKTNTMLSFVLRGASYLSDDRVWIGIDGSVRGYPLPINMLPYNYKSFPKIGKPGPINEAKRMAGDRVSAWVEDRDSVISQALYFVNQIYLEPTGEMERVEELIPGAQHVDETQTDRLIFLQTSPESGSESLVAKDMSEKEAARSLQAISQFEWNELIYRLAMVHGMLFPESDILSKYKQFEAAERRVFKRATQGLECHKLFLPREEKWTANQIPDRLISTVEEL